MPQNDVNALDVALKERRGLIACELKDLQMAVANLEESVDRLTGRLLPALRQQDCPASGGESKPEPMLPPLGEDLRQLRKRLLQMNAHVNRVADNCEL